MVLVVHQVLAAGHVVQHGGGVLCLGLAFLFRGIVGRPVGAEQIDQLVEQRHVRHRPRVAVGAQQRRVGARGAQPFGRRVQLCQQGFRRQDRPEFIERCGERFVVGQLCEQIRPQLFPCLAVLPRQPASADPGYRTLGEHVRDDLAEHRAGPVVRQPARARLLDGPLRGFGVDSHCDVRQFDRKRVFGYALPIGDRRREHVQDLA